MGKEVDSTAAPPRVDIDGLEAYYDERYEGDYMSSLGDVEVWRMRGTLRSIPLPPDASIVDYGCGRGVWVPVLQESFPGCRVVGIEISPTAVREAQRLHPDGDFRVFDGRRAPLADESYDLVFSYHVLEHVRDLSETVADMARLMRPGGYGCMVLPCGNRASIEELTTRLVTNGVERSSTGERRFFFEDPGHLRRLTSEQLAARFADHGCGLVEEFYGRHLAAVDYICSWPALVGQLFDPHRARSRAAAALLAVMRAWFLPIALLVKAQHVGARGLVSRLAHGPGAQARLLALGAFLAQPLSRPVGALVQTVLPRWEWRRSSGEPRGASAQFLVFRRSGGPKRRSPLAQSPPWTCSS